MLLDSSQLEGIVLIKDSPSCFGEPLIFALSKQNQPFVVTLKGRQKQLLQRYASRLLENGFLYFDSSSSISALKADILKSSTNGFCIIDSIEHLIDIFGIDKVASLLFDIKEKNMIIAIHCHYDTVTAEQWNKLCYVADTYLSISKKDSEFLANITSVKKNGKIQTLIESFSLNADLQLQAKKYIETPADDSNDLSMTTQFDVGLTLKDSEKSAKEALQLPYLSSKTQEGLVNLRLSDKKVRVGGQIIYTPDDGDDLDDSDPDDDLNL